MTADLRIKLAEVLGTLKQPRLDETKLERLEYWKLETSNSVATDRQKETEYKTQTSVSTVKRSVQRHIWKILTATGSCPGMTTTTLVICWTEQKTLCGTCV